MTDRLTKTAPKRIWLSTDQKHDERFRDAWSWSDETNGDPCEVEYVRADLVRAAMPANADDDPDLRRLKRVLGPGPVRQDLVAVPLGFYRDHTERDLPTPLAVKRSGCRVWVLRCDPNLPELLADAEHYVDTFCPGNRHPDDTCPRAVYDSAVRTVAALRAVPPKPAPARTRRARPAVESAR